MALFVTGFRASRSRRSVDGTMSDYTYLADAHRGGQLRDRQGFPDLELEALVERALDAH